MTAATAFPLARTALASMRCTVHDDCDFNEQAQEALAELDRAERLLADAMEVLAERDALRIACKGVKELVAERDALRSRLATCPYCAHTFEKQEGRRYSACPGCEKAHAAEAERDRLRAALEKIAALDYRGNMPNEQMIARKALEGQQ